MIDLTPAAKEDEMTPEEYDQAAVVKPGQTLILRYKQMIPASSADEIKRRLAQRLPGVDVLIIGGVDQILVYGPSESRTAPDQPET